MRKTIHLIVLFLCISLSSCNTTQSTIAVVPAVKQESIQRISDMPNFPKPFKILDFNQLAKDYDAKVYDVNQTGNIINLEDDSRKNFDQKLSEFTLLWEM
jgi:acetolactate synthase small subunit